MGEQKQVLEFPEHWVGHRQGVTNGYQSWQHLRQSHPCPTSPAKMIFHKLKNQKKFLKETPVEKKLDLAKGSAVIAGDIYLSTTCKLYLTSVTGDIVT